MTYDEAKVLLAEHYSEAMTRTILESVEAHERERIAGELDAEASYETAQRANRTPYYMKEHFFKVAADFVRRGKP